MNTRKQRRYFTWDSASVQAWTRDALELHINITPELEADKDRAHVLRLARNDIPGLIADLQRAYGSMSDPGNWNPARAPKRVTYPDADGLLPCGCPAQFVTDCGHQEGCVHYGTARLAGRIMDNAEAPHCRTHPQFRSDCADCVSVRGYM